MTDEFDVWVAECQRCSTATFHESKRDARLSQTLANVMKDTACTHDIEIHKAVIDEYTVVNDGETQ